MNSLSVLILTTNSHLLTIVYLTCSSYTPYTCSSYTPGYDVIKPLSKYITCDYGVFIAVTNGTKIIKIDQELREL